MTEQWRSLSVRQPWAHAIMHGGKDVENRTWGTEPGTIAIHASLRADDEAYRGDSLVALAMTIIDAPSLRRMPRGVILGTVDIVGVHLCDSTRGCYVKSDVLGWVPLDGSDASTDGWEPRFCSRWGEAPTGAPKRGWGWLRHFELANPRPLDHPIPFTGHLSIRPLDSEVQALVQARLDSQSPIGKPTRQ